MNNISLIANTGIQFYTFELPIDINGDVIKTMGFYESLNLDVSNLRALDVFLEYAYKVPGEDVWTPKNLLRKDGYIDDEGNFKEDVVLNLVLDIEEKIEKEKSTGKDEKYIDKFYKINDIETCLEAYEDVWLPLPYFKYNLQKKTSQLGPLIWSRIIFKNITPEDYKKGCLLYQVTLAFDTTTGEDSDTYYMPQDTDKEPGNNQFGISNNEDRNLDFCNPVYGCKWVLDALKTVRFGTEEPENYKYLAEYLYLLKYFSGLEEAYLRQKGEKELELKTSKNEAKRKRLEDDLGELESLLQSSVFPGVTLYSDESAAVDVDLVLDIGNANTCGLIFESPSDNQQAFNFNSVRRLKIQDLSKPGVSYDESFSMRLAFDKVDFGYIEVQDISSSCFQWPSLVRIGKEAQRLITQYNIDIDKGSETATNNSSPKRYLWDKKKSRIPWQYAKTYLPNKKELNDADIPQPANVEYDIPYIEGINHQFDASGQYTYDAVEASMADPKACYYSRRSLMTFVYLEIFSHALMQINSHEFRGENDGALEKPRRLRRVTITCPTAIVQEEQVILRQCALDAVKTISRYRMGKGTESIDKDELKIEFDIVPQPKELARSLYEARAGEKNDWIYDEATCNQLVFLYAEISKRYLNNSEAFFELYGRKRNDVDQDYQKSLTIASVDIGGGTTDLMVAAYEYAAEQSTAIIKPKPLYWESFILAGDDLLKEVIKQIVLEGNIVKEEERACKGVIKNYAIEKGCSNIAEKMQNFFGTDNTKQGYMKRIYRKNFIIQIAVPIALRYLQHASSKDDDRDITFEELFPEIKPNPELIRYFNRHFGAPFEFEEIVWRLSRARVYEIIDTTFDALIKQMSTLMAAYGCDFLLLSGKPATIPKIRQMFVKYFPTSPDRIISLDRYRVGRWYPNFGETPDASDLGYFKDPKTVVSVGALIALMGGKLDRLEGFRIDTEYLTKELTPTTDYIGALDTHTKDVRVIYLSPDSNKSVIEVSGLPVIIGYKQLGNDTYPGRPIYKLDFDEDYMRQKALRIDPNLEDEPEFLLQDAIEKEKNKIKKGMPLRIRLVRNYRESKEKIEVDYIRNRDRDDVNQKALAMELMTLPDESGYWLDTGEFILDI